mgnify:CR=1 FL=1
MSLAQRCAYLSLVLVLPYIGSQNYPQSWYTYRYIESVAIGDRGNVYSSLKPYINFLSTVYLRQLGQRQIYTEGLYYVKFASLRTLHLEIQEFVEEGSYPCDEFSIMRPTGSLHLMGDRWSTECFVCFKARGSMIWNITIYITNKRLNYEFVLVKITVCYELQSTTDTEVLFFFFLFLFFLSASAELVIWLFIRCHRSSIRH